MQMVNFFNESAEFETPERCHIVEMLNDNNDPELSIARARVKPGISTALHLLRDIVERYIIISGQGTVEINRKDPIAVGPLDIVNIPAGATQKINNTSQGEDLVFLCLCTPRFSPECYTALE